jgi:hypothetical protein
MQAGPGAQRAEARDAAAGELHQRLAAEARSAGAEKDDILRAGDEPLAASMPGRSSVFSGSRNSGSLPSAWRARMTASASPVRASASANARAVTP